MTYEESLDFLYNSLPVFHNIGAGAYKPGLDTSRALAALTGCPYGHYPTIHIAGTNGKGSTAHTLAAILRCAGFRTGLYTSPHIYDFRERIRVDGEMIPRREVTEFVEWWRGVSTQHPELHPSFFELTSTLAFDWFRRAGVDVAVIETGLGGRLDSTNIITPVLSVITNISLDHTALLGNTLAQIAGEKAGIIKPGVPVVIGESLPETAPVFSRKAREEGSSITFAEPIEGIVEADSNFYPSTPFGPLRGELQGECQVRNAATVMAAVAELRRLGWEIPDAAVREGMAGVTGLTHLFGRWSRIADAPLTVADTGHNSGGWELLARQVDSMEQSPKCLVLGFVADKDLSHILPLVAGLKGDVRLYFATPSVPRGLRASQLAEAARNYGLSGTAVDDVNEAVRLARAEAGEAGFVLVAGSNFLIADVKRELFS